MTMRILSLALFAAFFALPQAFACPDLSGEYRCPDPRGGKVQVSIEQNDNEFLLRGLEPIDHIIANDQWQNIANGDMYKNAKYKATCMVGHLQASIRGDVYQSGFYAGQAKVEMQLEKLKDGSLKRKIKGMLQGPFFSTPISDEGVCVAVKL